MKLEPSISLFCNQRGLSQTGTKEVATAILLPIVWYVPVSPNWFPPAQEPQLECFASKNVLPLALNFCK